MKNWMTRLFALVAVATVMGSTLMVGCGGGDDDDDAANNTTNAANNAATSEDTP